MSKDTRRRHGETHSGLSLVLPFCETFPPARMKYRSPTPKCFPTILNRNEDEAARIREGLAISRDIVLHQRNSPLTRSPRESSLSASARPEALGENSCMIPDERSRSVTGDDPRVSMTGRVNGDFLSLVLEK